MIFALRRRNHLKGEAIVSTQLMTAPESPSAIERPTRTYRDDLDLDDIDRALDQGDLDTVRRHLGLSRRHWFWLLQRL